MIELCLAVTTGQHQFPNQHRDDFVNFCQPCPAPTVLDFDGLMKSIEMDLSSSTFRLEINPVSQKNPATRPLRSFVMTAPIVFLGKGGRPPVDDDDFVYFDE